ncbi:MAG TPA: class I SAM-dependent methyltransferase [Candidatus Thermoplasmatota archaeon]|jgi:SAM-dependent methyltransferase|nr:class I SAM-dependent methyltransferase [Candidatus Thermoplasmatota archaeon]
MAAAWDALYAAGAPYHGRAPPPFFGPLLVGDAVVLDIGCGAGKSLAALRQAGPRWRLLGVDAASPAVRLAARHAPAAQADARALPLRDACVDAVRIDHLLGHLDDRSRGAAAREVERVLRPGGWLEVREAMTGDLRDGAGRSRGARAWERGGIVTRYVREGELAALFRTCPGEESVDERAVRFASRPRRALVLRARRL